MSLSSPIPRPPLNGEYYGKEVSILADHKRSNPTAHRPDLVDPVHEHRPPVVHLVVRNVLRQSEQHLVQLLTRVGQDGALKRKLKWEGGLTEP